MLLRSVWDCITPVLDRGNVTVRAPEQDVKPARPRPRTRRPPAAMCGAGTADGITVRYQGTS
jgi:hypothetical protein